MNFNRPSGAPFEWDSSYAKWREQALAWWGFYAAPFTAAYVLTLVVYSYLFTTIVITNHTLPNVWPRNFPSHSTFAEGRWFNDVIYALVGVGGTQSFQMAVACGIQIVNGFLFAAVLRITSRVYIFIAAAFLSLYPAVLDYYSFTSDHIAFVAGDTFALLGILALDRIGSRKASVAASAVCFLLCLATYPPKVALVAVLLLIWSIRGTLDRQDVSSLLRDRIVPATVAFVLALTAYYLSTKLVVVGVRPRTHLNYYQAFLRQVLLAYPEVLRYFAKADYLPRLLHALPLVSVALGAGALVWQARNNGWPIICGLLLLLVLFPIALQLSYIINDATWRNSGRILSVHAYFMLFFLASAWTVPRLQAVSTAIAVVMLYYFAIVGSQETNAAALKTIYDVQKLNRIVARVENIIPPRGSGTPLVVIGEMDKGNFAGQRFRSYSNSLYRPHLSSSTFAPYRQVEFLNFFLGRESLTRPSKREVGAAIASAKDRQPWPSPEAVYMQGGVLVILLSRYKPGTEITWSR